MIRLTSRDALPSELRDAVIAVGNFDGYHRSHQSVIAAARAKAGAEGRPLIVATFDPHPATFFAPDRGPIRLTTIDQCERLFARSGADAMMVLSPDSATTGLSAKDFVEWLSKELGAAAIVTGSTFNFGKTREGDLALLRTLCDANGIAHHVAEPQADDGGVISSDRIRQALIDGNCELATQLLSRPFSIVDSVRHGHKIGRTIGFPTANLFLNEYQRPKYGVYVVRGRIPKGRVLDGVANLGIRPMMAVEEEILEPHFFDFTGDLYDQKIEIELIAYMRGEIRLSGLDELKEWIQRDCAQARSVLAKTPHYV